MIQSITYTYIYRNCEALAHFHPFPTFLLHQAKPRLGALPLTQELDVLRAEVAQLKAVDKVQKAREGRMHWIRWPCGFCGAR